MPAIYHLTHGDLYADLVRDRRDRDLWLYVIQREHSADVLAMGSCSSEQAARETATRLMQDLVAARSDSATAS